MNACIGFDEGRRTYKFLVFSIGPPRTVWKLASIAFLSSSVLG